MCPIQGILTEKEDSVQLTSLYQLVQLPLVQKVCLFYKNNLSQRGGELYSAFTFSKGSLVSYHQLFS
jgi:hypothetical protein